MPLEYHLLKVRKELNRVFMVLLRVSGAVLILLSITVSIPLLIHTYREGGGPWGFGVIQIPVLLPLSAYVLFGVAGFVRQRSDQRKYFIAAHVVTLLVGLISLYVFPVYPVFLTLIPLFLATFGIINKEHFQFYLLLMIWLAIVANILLLKWELEFGRSIPVLQFF